MRSRNHCADAKFAAAANSVRAWNQRQSIQVRYFNSTSEYKDANEKKRQKSDKKSSKKFKISFQNR